MFLEQFPTEGRQHGWIEVICGSMFSGKTEELIRRLKRVEFAQQKLLLFKPAIDDRYDEENVVSHKGSSFTAIPVNSSAELLKHWKKERIVAIDEAQFFDQQLIDVCNELAKQGVRVIVAGLDMDYLGKPFGLKSFVCTMAMAMKAHLSWKVSKVKHGGIKGCSSSFGMAKVSTMELSKKASTAKGWFFRDGNMVKVIELFSCSVQTHSNKPG